MNTVATVPLLYGIQIATHSHKQLKDEIALDFQEAIHSQQGPSETYIYRFILFKHTGLLEATYQSKIVLHLKLLQR